MRGPADRARIDLSEDWEVGYWARELGCSQNDLRRLVAKAGPLVADVRAALEQQE
jgi:hypothetical protein